jgi:hypothetical protein
MGRFLLLLALAVAASAGRSRARGQDAATEIRAEIARLRGVVNAKPDADPEWKRIKPRLASLLAQASDSLAAGRLYLSLEELEAARTPLRSFETAKDPAAPEKDMAAFRGRLEEDQRRARGHRTAGRGAPAAVAGGGPGGGYYYMGEAKVAIETARFCSLLHISRPQAQAPLPLRSVAPELGPPGADGGDLQASPLGRAARRVHRLELDTQGAGELDAARLYAGALYKLLDATEQLGALEPRTLDATQRTAVKKSLATLRGRLAGSSRDESIGLLFLERAEGHLAGPAPGEDDWKDAAVVAEQVLPAYFAYLQGPPPSAPPIPPAAGTLAVTLVRWPFT